MHHHVHSLFPAIGLLKKTSEKLTLVFSGNDSHPKFLVEPHESCELCEHLQTLGALH